MGDPPPSTTTTPLPIPLLTPSCRAPSRGAPHHLPWVYLAEHRPPRPSLGSIGLGEAFPGRPAQNGNSLLSSF